MTFTEGIKKKYTEVVDELAEIKNRHLKKERILMSF